MVSGTDTVAVVQAEGPRPVIGLFAGRTGAVLMQAPSKTDTICRGYPAHAYWEFTSGHLPLKKHGTSTLGLPSGGLTKAFWSWSCQSKAYPLYHPPEGRLTVAARVPTRPAQPAPLVV